ncbi:MAG: rod-binding protein [Parvularculaceae bacterium]|nr:rod-binding protein [Parvularculaceae bacterium]
MSVAPLAPVGADIQPDLNIDGVARSLTAAQAPEDVRKAAEEFEAVFLNQFVGSMFEGMKTDGMFGGGQGEKMWQGFLVQHIADAFAQRGGIGIADMVTREILQAAESPE